MNTATIKQEITDLFTQTKRCVETLYDCLQHELECLKQNQSEQLINNAMQKKALMEELSGYETRRKEITRSNQLTSKSEYLTWLKTLDPSNELLTQWQDISQHIKNCQKLNATNGIVSEKMAQTSLDILNILSGNSAESNTTYTAEGLKPDSAASLHNTTA